MAKHADLKARAPLSRTNLIGRNPTIAESINEETATRGSRRKARVQAVMASAERSGLLCEKTGRIAGRVSPVLIERARALTGIMTDTELLEFALANVALEDNFAESFREIRSTVDPELELGF